MSHHYFVIIGALSDLGRGMTWRLAALNIPLLLIDSQADKLATLSDELVAAGHQLPLLAAIRQDTLESDCYALASNLPSIAGAIWTGYWLDQPIPIAHESLTHWQQSLQKNIIYPLWLIKTLLPAIKAQQARLHLAIPAAEAYTGALAASSHLWLHWATQLAAEFSIAADQIQPWRLPKLADRIHRRIWPLLDINAFTPIDQAIDIWLQQWQSTLIKAPTK